jgi:hypothetical protein
MDRRFLRRAAALGLCLAAVAATPETARRRLASANGAFTVDGLSLDDAQAHTAVFAAAVADVAAVDADAVSTAAVGRESVVIYVLVSYDMVDFADVVEAGEAKHAVDSSVNSGAFDDALSAAAADAGVSATFAGVTVGLAATAAPTSAAGSSSKKADGPSTTEAIAVAACAAVAIGVAVCCVVKGKHIRTGIKVAISKRPSFEPLGPRPDERPEDPRAADVKKPARPPLPLLNLGPRDDVEDSRKPEEATASLMSINPEMSKGFRLTFTAKNWQRYGGHMPEDAVDAAVASGAPPPTPRSRAIAS